METENISNQDLVSINFMQHERKSFDKRSSVINFGKYSGLGTTPRSICLSPYLPSSPKNEIGKTLNDMK